MAKNIFVGKNSGKGFTKEESGLGRSCKTRRFDKLEDAEAFVGSLPNCKSGIYYIDAPETVVNKTLVKETKPVRPPDGPEEITFNSLEDYKQSEFGRDHDAMVWIRAGKPILWILVETLGKAKFYMDQGYGYIKLQVGNEYVFSHTYTSVLGVGKYVAMDKDYWGLSKNIWR